MNSTQQPMHPEDMRNMKIFFVLSLIVFAGYYQFVMKPKAEALRLAQLSQRAAQTQTVQAAPDSDLEADLEVKPRIVALAEAPRVSIENDEITGSLSLKGARLDDIALKRYHKTIERNDPVEILSPAHTDLPRAMEQGWVAESKDLRIPGPDTLWRTEGDAVLSPGAPLTLFWENGAGLRFERVYSIDNKYTITLEQRVVNTSGRPVSLFPYGLVSQRGIPPDFVQNWLLHEGPIGYIGEALHEVNYADLKKTGQRNFSGAQGWIGITDKYWLVAVMPAQGMNAQYRFLNTGTQSPAHKRDTTRFQADYTGEAVRIEPGQTGSYTLHIYAGAKEYYALSAAEETLGVPNFTLAVNFGWFWFLAKPFFYVLHFLGEMTGNFGVAIILLTVVIRSSVFPLTNVSYKSFAKMKKVAPQVAELRERVGDDKQKLQQELMQLYQREGVNPLAGCIPILLQIPIFFALYKVLFVTIEMRHAPFFGWIRDLSAPDPSSYINLFGLLPYDVPQAIPIPLLGPILIAVMHIGFWPCLMLLGMIIQKHLNPPPQDPIQRDMANYFPFIMAFVLANFASGLVIYWTFSAFIGIAQRLIIMRSLGVPIYLFGQTEAEAKIEKSLEQGPAVHPLADMASEEMETALFAHEDGTVQGDDQRPAISPPRQRRKKKKR